MSSCLNAPWGSLDLIARIAVNWSITDVRRVIKVASMQAMTSLFRLLWLAAADALRRSYTSSGMPFKVMAVGMSAPARLNHYGIHSVSPQRADA
jgi:hypothetical protein